MSTPYSLEDTLRRHDAAIYSWLLGLHVDYGDVSGKTLNDVPVLSIFTSPDRAFAEIPSILIARNWIAGANPAEQKANADKLEVLPLPLVSIERGDPALDPEQAGAPKQFRLSNFNPISDALNPHSWPAFYKVEYTLTYWSSKRYTENHMREWVMSQLGKRGAGNNETFIPVPHLAPFGTLLHSLKFTGGSDQSEYEGEKERDIRFAFTFELRMLYFRAPLPALDPVNAIGGDVLQPSLQADEAGTDGATIDSYGRVEDFSANLYVDFLSYFPRVTRVSQAVFAALYGTTFDWIVGGTIVSNEKITPRDEVGGARFPTLRIETTQSTDSICILERPINADDAGNSIVSMSFRYLATKTVQIDIQQKDPATGAIVKVFTRSLPATTSWKRVHCFTLLGKPIVRVVVHGADDPAIVRLFRLDVRNLSTQEQTAYDVVENSGGYDQYVWTNQQSSQALLVVSKIGSSPGDLNFIVQDDKDAPRFTSQQLVSAETNYSAVALIQPKQSSIRVKVTEGTNFTLMNVQPYKGVFNGNE